MVVAVVAVVEVVVVVVATDPTTTLVDKISWWVDPGYLKFFVDGSLRIFFLRSLSSLSLSILNCIIFIILISTRSRGGSDATRSHKAAAPASVEQTECGSKISQE